jgi:probable HAF family extracellular repeat protein
MCPWIFLPALGLSCALLAVDPATAQTYTVTDLGVLPGQDFSAAIGINNSGEVIGYASNLLYGLPFGYPYYYFLYRDGKLSALSSPGEPQVAALGIALDDGKDPRQGNEGKTKLILTGDADFGQNQFDAFLYEDHFLRDLGLLPGGHTSMGIAVNASGEVVGTADNADYEELPFLYKNGNMVILGTGVGSPSGINDQGDVTGTASSGGNVSYAFLYHDGKMMDLGTLPGAVMSSGAAINNAMQITGQSSSADYLFSHAFLWSKGKMIDLGVLPNGTVSDGLGINAWGDVVGTADSQAFLYSHGQMHNLNDMIPSNSGWSLRGARSINDRGDIVGTGYINGAMGGLRGFLLTVDCKNSKNKDCDECKRGH